MQIDKKAHFLAGLAITALMYPFGLQIALAAGIAAAVGKELVDKVSQTGTPDINDAVATIIGSLVAAGWFTAL